MAELEQVEKLREKANVTFTEAKDALDASGGDILEALIYLENQGKAVAPPGGGFYSSGSAAGACYESAGSKERPRRDGESFWDILKRFGRFCLRMIDKGNRNFLDGYKNGEVVFSCPVTGIVILMLFLFWVVVPLFILSLFFGFRYRFRGEELGRDAVNKAMDSATDAAEELKKSFGVGGEK